MLNDRAALVNQSATLNNSVLKNDGVTLPRIIPVKNDKSRNVERIKD